LLKAIKAEGVTLFLSALLNFIANLVGPGFLEDHETYADRIGWVTGGGGLKIFILHQAEITKELMKIDPADSGRGSRSSWSFWIFLLPMI